MTTYIDRTVPCSSLILSCVCTPKACPKQMELCDVPYVLSLWSLRTGANLLLLFPS